jgi:ribose/xylose/arabinose/galactoside ABC-type transport system permease subunit
MTAPAARLLRTGGPLLGLLLTWLLFATTANGFTSWANHELMLLQTAVVGVAAIGATWVIVGGGIDLSVGSTIAVASMVGALAMRAGAAWPLAAAATVSAGALVGALIGALVTGAVARVAIAAAAVAAAVLATASWSPPLRIALAAMLGAVAWFATARLPWSLPLSPFIVTLGLWGALRGLAKGIGDNQPIYFAAEEHTERNRALASLMQPGDALLPIGVWVLLASAALAALALRTTVFGRHVRALGSNREAARLSGVDVGRTELLVYVVGGTCAGLAGVLQLAYLSMGDPTTAQGYELKAIAAAVIGGASLAGGEGSIVGALLGALVMTVVDNGCTKLGLDNWVQEVVTGAIIVGAVALDRWRQQRR